MKCAATPLLCQKIMQIGWKMKKLYVNLEILSRVFEQTLILYFNMKMYFISNDKKENKTNTWALNQNFITERWSAIKLVSAGALMILPWSAGAVRGKGLERRSDIQLWAPERWWFCRGALERDVEKAWSAGALIPLDGPQKYAFIFTLLGESPSGFLFVTYHAVKSV